MKKPKKISQKSTATYISEKLEEKDALINALQTDQNLKEFARERGIEFVQPI
jgi:hypothetical protein